LYFLQSPPQREKEIMHILLSNTFGETVIFIFIIFQSFGHTCHSIFLMKWEIFTLPRLLKEKHLSFVWGVSWTDYFFPGAPCLTEKYIYLHLCSWQRYCFRNDHNEPVTSRETKDILVVNNEIQTFDLNLEFGRIHVHHCELYGIRVFKDFSDVISGETNNVSFWYYVTKCFTWNICIIQ
jgi:hypothetical protein